MKNLAFVLVLIFAVLAGTYFLLFAPEKYQQPDLYDKIMHSGVIKVGINIDSKPYGFIDKNGEISGYDADLARYIAHYIVKSPNAVKFVPVTPANRMLKASTGEVDIVIATMTITPQRQEILDFSIPYDTAGQALLVRNGSRITSINDLAGQNVGVIFGTTAERNMQNLVPSANVLGFKTYHEAYEALKNGAINAITSDDTILSGFALEDKSVKLLPKRYSREPYGIGFKKGRCSAKLKQNIDFAITDLRQKNVITRLRHKWGLG